MKSADKNFIRHSLITMSAYVAVTYASKIALRGLATDWPVLAKATLAITPVVPIIYFLKAYVRYLSECDELIRRIELEAIGLSTMVVALLFLSLSLLGHAKIIALDGNYVANWAFPLLCLFYCLTRWLASRRYQ